MLSLCLFVRKRTNNHYRERKKSSENIKREVFIEGKGAIIWGLHDFERNTEKRHFHRGLKNMKVRTFFQEKRSGESCFSKKLRFAQFWDL